MPTSLRGSELDLDRLVLMSREELARGDALAAVDRLQRLEHAEHSPESRKLLAHALLRAGAIDSARAVLAALLAAGFDDEETLGLAAREAKARWQLGQPSALQEARDAYLHAYRKTGGLWTGINAATLTLAAGNLSQARQLAGEVLAKATRLGIGAQEDYWTRAVVAEALLVTGELPTALGQYRLAVAAAPGAFGNYQSTLENAAIVIKASALDPALLAGIFPQATVVAFCGPILEALPGGAARPYFEEEFHVASHLATAAGPQHVDVGIASAAYGADILFLEAVHLAGGEIHVVLPCSAADFRRISVAAIGGEQWGRRFDNLLRVAEQVTELAPHPGEELSRQFHGAVLAGLAIQRAAAIGGRACGLAWWNGGPSRVGGTATILSEWRSRGFKVHAIGSEPGPEAQSTAGDPRRAPGQRIVTMLFADAVGFSRLDDAGVKLFVQEFWGRVAKTLSALPTGAVLFANTWGDGLFLVFADTADGARIAVAISEMVRGTDWNATGLPPETSMRIALHAGPAYEVNDPVTERPGFAGMHVSRAARIEPVTPPGLVYTSEAFAALLALDQAGEEFRCEYVGTVPLAKGYGRMRTYSLARIADAGG